VYLAVSHSSHPNIAELQCSPIFGLLPSPNSINLLPAQAGEVTRLGVALAMRHRQFTTHGIGKGDEHPGPPTLHWSMALYTFFILPYLCPYPLTQNGQIRHGNISGGACF